MNLLEFILGVIIVIAVVFIVVGGLSIKYDTEKLEKENLKLQEDLRKARERKTKKEYKKATLGGKK